MIAKITKVISVVSIALSLLTLCFLASRYYHCVEIGKELGVSVEYSQGVCRVEK